MSRLKRSADKNYVVFGGALSCNMGIMAKKEQCSL